MIKGAAHKLFRSNAFVPIHPHGDEVACLKSTEMQ